jgi:hypothetical protein
VLIPILYLKGISTGDFEEALIALLGKDAGGLSASTIGWLKEAWSDEHTRWRPHARLGVLRPILAARTPRSLADCSKGFRLRAELRDRDGARIGGDGSP